MAKTAIGSEKYAMYDTATLLGAYKEGPERIKMSIDGLEKEDFYNAIIDCQKKKKPGNRMIYGLLPTLDLYVVALPVQFSNFFLDDLKRLASIAA